MRQHRGNPKDFLPYRFTARKIVRFSGKSAKAQPRNTPPNPTPRNPEAAPPLRNQIEAGDLRGSFVKSRRDFFPLSFAARKIVRFSGEAAKSL
ncbi:MAG: hypothetical protein LBN04_06710 [Oscillospiraceae bacterium]|jgi:hypothetical protein|nr:hypothetical protein [Oscillospiraceae bacterium]